ncbi:hypothetical protein LDDCCGHA_4376 [Methylobacterium oxalidis]|nr:hypothetical protein LDDCCGHA_4376 [Methylobacterium oxalidis]
MTRHPILLAPLFGVLAALTFLAVGELLELFGTN